MQEFWKEIPEASTYLVSNRGRIKNWSTGRIMRQSITNKYLAVKLRENGQNVPRRVHRLVAKAFCPGYSPDLDVNHIDGNKLNNNDWNLEWVTRQDNIRHAFLTGLSVSGRRTPVRIIETGEVFVSQTACAEAINGKQSSINAVLKGNMSRHRGYTFEYA